MSEPSDAESVQRSTSARWIIAALAVVAACAIAGVLLYRKPLPPPQDIASDALLRTGHALYHTRCVSCHGPTGRGDGPIAKSAGPTPVGDLTAGNWKHGDSPEKVLDVITHGVRGTSMSAWDTAFNPEELRALAAFVFHLGGRAVPSVYRVDNTQPAQLR